jgi:hypothetical protein
VPPTLPAHGGFYNFANNVSQISVEMGDWSSSFLAALLLPIIIAPIMAIIFTCVCCGLRMNRQGHVFQKIDFAPPVISAVRESNAE